MKQTLIYNTCNKCRQHTKNDRIFGVVLCNTCENNVKIYQKFQKQGEYWGEIEWVYKMK